MYLYFGHIVYLYFTKRQFHFGCKWRVMDLLHIMFQLGSWLMTCHVFVWDWTRSQVSHCPGECYHAIVTSTSFCLSVSNMTWGTCGEGLHSWHSTEWISLSPLDMNKLILNSNNGFWHFFLLTLSVVSSGIFAYIHQSCEVVIVSPIRLYSTYLVITLK